MKEETKQNNDGITIIEHDGELYFSDEYYEGILSHPLDIPSHN